MKDLGISILRLRGAGLSYRQIEKELGCSRGIVAYYCGDTKSSRGNRKHYARYGLTEIEYDAMLDRFGGLCWSCKTATATHVDHNHNCCPKGTGCANCVRGVLCHHCNSLLGFAKDDLSILKSAIIYLETL